MESETLLILILNGDSYLWGGTQGHCTSHARFMFQSFNLSRHVNIYLHLAVLSCGHLFDIVFLLEILDFLRLRRRIFG